MYVWYVSDRNIDRAAEWATAAKDETIAWSAPDI